MNTIANVGRQHSSQISGDISDHRFAVRETIAKSWLVPNDYWFYRTSGIKDQTSGIKDGGIPDVQDRRRGHLRRPGWKNQ